MKAEGIGNKVLLITMLCAALGLFLYLRPTLFAPEPKATLMDRLPEGDIIGRFYLLEIARETNGMLFKQKVAFREYLTYDFLLTQAKNYGLDLQKPGYFFSDSKSEWGSFISLSDSSKVLPGFQRIQQYLDVKDTLVFNHKVRKIEKLGLYIFYDKSYLFVYRGGKIKQRFGKALFAKHGETESSWRKFNEIRTFKSEKLVVFSQTKRLKSYGIDYGLFAHDSDSSSFKLKTFLHSNYDLKIKLKEPGLALAPSSEVTKMLNLHLDITQFKQDRNHPLYKLISDLARKIGFPTEAFLAAWNGDLSFREGGLQLVDEEVVEMGYDDEFNQIEKRTIKKVPVTGFSVVMSVNKFGKAFLNKLFAKGIVNKQGAKYRFLFSPPLSLSIKKDVLSAYTSSAAPKYVKAEACNGIWNYKGTRVEFQLDSLKTRDIYGSIHFGVSKFLKKNKLF
jgi:hypothetical protein